MAAAAVTTHLQPSTAATIKTTVSVATNLKTTTSTNEDSVNVISLTTSTIDNTTTNTITNTSSKRSAGVLYLTPTITSTESLKASSLLSPSLTTSTLDVNNFNGEIINEKNKFIEKQNLNITKDVKEATCQSFLLTDNGDDLEAILIDNSTQTEEHELEPCVENGFQCDCWENHDNIQFLENQDNDNLSIIKETERVQKKVDNEKNFSKILTKNIDNNEENLSEPEKFKECAYSIENSNKKLSITFNNNNNKECTQTELNNETKLEKKLTNDNQLHKPKIENLSITTKTSDEYEYNSKIFPKINESGNKKLTNKIDLIKNDKKLQKCNTENFQQYNTETLTITNDNINKNDNEQNYKLKAQKIHDNQCKKLSITSKIKKSKNRNVQKNKAKQQEIPQKLSITNEILIKSYYNQETIKNCTKTLSITNKAKENIQNNTQILSITNNIPAKNEVTQEKLSIIEKFQENKETDNQELSISNDIQFKNQETEESVQKYNKNLTITNEIEDVNEINQQKLSINNTIPVREQLTQEISKSDNKKLSITNEVKENTEINFQKLSIINDIPIRGQLTEAISKNHSKKLSRVNKIQENTEIDKQELSIFKKIQENTQIDKQKLSITNDVQGDNQVIVEHEQNIIKKLSIANEFQENTKINIPFIPPAINISVQSHKIEKNSNENLSLTNDYTNDKQTIKNVNPSKHKNKIKTEKTNDETKRSETKQTSDVSLSITFNKTNDGILDSIESKETKNQLGANNSSPKNCKNPINCHDSDKTDNKPINIDKSFENLTTSSTNNKKSKNKLINMVLGQQNNSLIQTKNDNLTNIDKKLKNKIANMENKKKKHKDSGKCNKITNKSVTKTNEVINKTVNLQNAQNVLSVTDKSDVNIKSVSSVKSVNLLSISTDKSDSSETTNKLDTQILQSTIDFDEDFWACTENENDNQILTHESECNGFSNGHESIEKCCDYCNSENDNLSITLKIYGKNSEKHNKIYKNKNDNLSITRDNSKDNLKSTNQDSRESETQISLNNDEIVADNLRLEMNNRNDNCELENAIQDSAAVLNSSDNCLCFCTEADHNVLSIVENGFVLHHANNEGRDDDDDDDDDDEIDEKDLPNYSRSCVYEERIIDFENFRIIEQVIDNNCEGKHTATNNIKCRNTKDYKNIKKQKHIEDGISQNDVKGVVQEIDNLAKTVQNVSVKDNDNKLIDIADEENCNKLEKQNIYENPSLNFSCSELVAFIGESFQVLDNAQALYRNDNNLSQDNLKKPLLRSSSISQFKNKESSSVGNSPFKRCKRATTYASVNNNSNRSVDDNNNTRRYAGITAAERLMQSLNCDVARELTQSRKDKRDVKPKAKQQPTNTKAVTPTKTLLKALKSKLTPLAPPFQPAAVKAQMAATSTNPSNNSATLVNYEQTTIYYQHQQQQPQQQLIMPTNSSANNMLHALHFPPSPATPQQQQVSISQQQPLFIPHHQQHALQTLNHHVQQHHQQHCAQNILAMSAAASMGQAMPHIHLPATATATNNGNLSTATAVINVGSTTSPSGQHLLPIHLLTAVGGVSSWPLIEATSTSHNTATPTIYVDINGELRSICPAHGPPPPLPPQPSLATALTVTPQPMAPITNQTAVSATNSTQHSNPSLVCLNPSQYPLTITAQYHAQQQQQQQQTHSQLHHHHHQQQQQQQQLQHHNLYHSQHQPILANSQNSPLRIKSNSNVSATATNNAGSSTSSSSSSAVAAPPRVVLQLDAGVSLPLQIAGKRKLFRGECTLDYNSYIQLLQLYLYFLL